MLLPVLSHAGIHQIKFNHLTNYENPNSELRTPKSEIAAARSRSSKCCWSSPSSASWRRWSFPRWWAAASRRARRPRTPTFTRHQNRARRLRGGQWFLSQEPAGFDPAAEQRQELARAVSGQACRWIRGAILTFITFPGKHNPNGFDLFSVGPDGKAGTDDDIGNWTK